MTSWASCYASAKVIYHSLGLDCSMLFNLLEKKSATSIRLIASRKEAIASRLERLRRKVLGVWVAQASVRSRLKSL